MKHYKFGYTAIIGRPNVGKSTILNRIIGQKIAITTDKAQTTRRRINGILTTEEAQIVFVDTPGIHKPLDKLGECLVDEAKSAVPDVDLILFVVDGSTTAGRGDKWIVENVLKNYNGNLLIVINKYDLIKDIKKREENLLTYKTLFEKNYPCIKISAKTGRNFDTLINNIIRKLPAGEKVYDDEIITDETMRNIARELIREKILLYTHDEVPHSVAVIIESYEELEKLDKISAKIIVEQETQKGILIGKNGAMLKKIGTEARKELELTADKKVYLDLQVKVIKDWRKKSKDLGKMY
ncbi:MAG: GTPase Era [Candidatus Gastranaerophilales bacterium]|nr:GTPase Era [Candidatus Gastranaerophilales bacterium]